MPKPGNRGGNPKKPAPKPITSNEDDSYIVFGNGKNDGKAKKAETRDVAGQNGVKTINGPGEDAPKKPDTRTLIGGASWTGKLPVNMLSEHCQKQRWQKPEYTMVGYSEVELLL